MASMASSHTSPPFAQNADHLELGRMGSEKREAQQFKGSYVETVATGFLTLFKAIKRRTSTLVSAEYAFRTTRW
jgi:hypothetical protein